MNQLAKDDRAASRVGSRPAPLAGYVFGTISATGYTTANLFLRAVTDVDPVWVSCIKALPTIALVAPWVVVLAFRGKLTFPSTGMTIALMVGSIIGNVGGNVLFQWSLGIVGVALAVPLTLGAVIVSGAVLARVFLDEAVGARKVISIAILVAAISILSLGAGEASLSLPGERAPSTVQLVCGVMAACASGVAYTVMGLILRYIVRDKAPLSLTLLIIATTGVVVLAAMSFGRLGLAVLGETSQRDWLTMLAAGVCNAIAFIALARALKVASIVLVNALNASQVALCALGGVVLFQEAPSLAMYIGVTLTAGGLLIMKEQSPRQLSGASSKA
ncbi:MAG: DMT family transporter [Pirellulaceae bacterium]|jgi:drug/metabolite transporter (DMT)-like permease|nr:DMT family transporter [Pirellulaceae bacterium]MDP7020462.1 DMT family transporter [Pirellulaceae bacterium]